jgi:hypothetical protein
MAVLYSVCGKRKRGGREIASACAPEGKQTSAHKHTEFLSGLWNVDNKSCEGEFAVRDDCKLLILTTLLVSKTNSYKKQ